MKHFRINAIENSGPNTLVSFLRNVGHTAVQIDIGVAFVTDAGLASVLYVLKRVAARGNVRLLTGLYQWFTEPKALSTLVRAQHDSNNRLSVHLSSDAHFHWKFYCLKGKHISRVAIGSSNLTLDGLSHTGEINAVLSLPNDSAPFRHLQGLFERHWNSKSKPLTEDIVRRYETGRASLNLDAKLPKVPINKILGAGRKAKHEPKREPSFWRTCIVGKLSEEAESLLAETTDWDRHGYLYFNTWKPTYSVGDQLVLFDLTAKRVSAVEIRETTETPVSTPDGHHFAAYRRIRNIPSRRLVPNRWKMLKAAKLIGVQSDARSDRKLSQKRFESFVNSLRVSTQ